MGEENRKGTPHKSASGLAAVDGTNDIRGTIGESEGPRALQIVSIGTEADEYAFTYHERALREILCKVPPHQKVAVVSVVGAFRTGKSFLLSWFLRYLKHHYGASEVDINEGEDVPEIVSEDEGSYEEKRKPWYTGVESVGRHDGFDWRGGSERNTTGIWVWSEPFTVPIRKNRGGEEDDDGEPDGKSGDSLRKPGRLKSDEAEEDEQEEGKSKAVSAHEMHETEDVAVLLVDTQGMFDHETTMSLTASIFGLSTLLSSYQIYNVDKRIQEDNLQQLALFSEYGRIALETEEKDEGGDRATKEGLQPQRTETRGVEQGSVQERAISRAKKRVRKPFQKIEFLVRDWQNFESDEDEIDEMLAEMQPYLDSVFEERNAADLKETREQINACFGEISCFMFTHPGFAVTKKKYQGEVKLVDPTFLMLLERFCDKVFGKDNLEPKVIHGRELTALELEAYIRAYARMFESGAHFPEAHTMLEATASANNANATNISISKYREEMERLAGPNCSIYVKPEEFRKQHELLKMSSLRVFDDMADFGSKRSIESARDSVLHEIEMSHGLYLKLNESRNPLMGFETFIVPMAIAVASLVLRYVADNTCSSWSQTCRASSDILSQVYAVIFIFLLIVAATKAKMISARVRKLKAAFCDLP